MAQYLCICVGAYWFSAMLISKWPPCGHIGFFGFRTLNLVWLWVSTPNLSGTILIYMGRSLLIFSDVTFKMVTWWPYCIFIRPSLDGTYYGMALSVRSSVRSSVRPTVSTKKHSCKWRIFFKFCTQVCLGVPSINLLFVLSYLIKYAHNSIISDFNIFGIHRVIF